MPTVLALFQTPSDAERAIAELSLNGFGEKDVSLALFSAVPAPNPGPPGLIGWLSRGGFLGDSIDQADGTSVMDGVGVGATIFSLLGMILGSQWQMGPIAASTGGLLVGGLVGYLLDKLIPEKRRDQVESSLINGLILVKVSSASGDKSEAAKRLLQANNAKQLAVLPRPDGGG